MSRQGFAYAFTVFTPTYNRARLLSRVYGSLAAQSFRDFEWLIVDDGSTDGTDDLVAAWQKEAAFPIRYLRQENRGKHAAFNRGVAEARGELFLPLDSDDAALPQALERLHFHWQAIPQDKRGDFAAVTALCADESGRVVGERFPADVFDSNSMEINRRYKVRGEKWGFTRTEVLRRFPYPEPPGAKFVPEGIVWSRVATRYKTRFVNEPLRVYFGQAGDQLSRAGLKLSHLPGLALWHQVILNEESSWFAADPLYFLHSGLNYARFSFLLGRGLGEQWGGLSKPLAKVLWLAGLLPGWLLASRQAESLIEG